MFNCKDRIMKCKRCGLPLSPSEVTDGTGMCLSCEVTHLRTFAAMARHYYVTIEYLGKRKKEEFQCALICLDKQGEFLVMDSAGEWILFHAKRCKVEEIHAHVIVVSGFTDKPEYITAYCRYATNRNGE